MTNMVPKEGELMDWRPQIKQLLETNGEKNTAEMIVKHLSDLMNKNEYTEIKELVEQLSEFRFII